MTATHNNEKVSEIEVVTPRLRTHALVSGPLEAPAVIFIHGNVSSSRFFQGIMAALSPKWRTYAPDLRGFGKSETKGIDATKGVAEFAEDLFEFINSDEIGLKDRPVHLVGWSMGGGVAMQYCIDHPSSVASLVLQAPMSPYGFGGTRDETGTPCWSDFAGSGGGTANSELVARLNEKDTTADSPASPRSVINSVYFRPPFRVPASEEDALVDAMNEMAISDMNYPGDMTTSPNWPFFAPGNSGVNNAISPKFCNLERFWAIDPQPDVLWIRGDSDQIVSDESLSDVHYLGVLDLIPGWPGEEAYPAQPMLRQLRQVLDHYQKVGGRYREEVIANCGHSPHLEHPGVVIELIENFFLNK